MNLNESKLSEENLIWLREVEANLQQNYQQSGYSDEIKCKASHVQSLISKCRNGLATVSDVSSALCVLEEFAHKYGGIELGM